MADRTAADDPTMEDMFQFNVSFAALLMAQLTERGAMERHDADMVLRGMASFIDESSTPGLRRIAREFEFAVSQRLDLPPARGRRVKPPSAAKP